MAQIFLVGVFCGACIGIGCCLLGEWLGGIMYEKHKDDQ